MYQLYIQRHPWQPKHLFAPLITSSWNAPYDCDYNFHKSNSTYFADLDVSRAHLVSAILRVGMRRLNRGDTDGLPPAATEKRGGPYNIALGGVACMFQREVEPMAGFDIYTRILSWDRKWLYIVSHMVKKGKIAPGSYVMQPWRRREAGYARKVRQEEAELVKHIYASSISRYVVKKGRLTVNPEIVLERSRLLPRRPEGVGLPPRAELALPVDASAGSEAQAAPDAHALISGPERVASVMTSTFSPPEMDADDGAGGWTWDEMEAERLRGLKLASHFDALSGLTSELRTEEVLGKFSDWF